MAGRARGSVVEVPGTDGTVTYALRFVAAGKRRYRTLGSEPEWTPNRADAELCYVLGQVDRGTWQAPEPTRAAAAERDVPTFHVFASEWFERHRDEWRPKTVRAYRGELVGHLLPYFATMPLDRIGVADVDRYRAAKLAEHAAWKRRAAKDRQRAGRAPAGPASINKTLVRLGQILEEAVEYEIIDRNPARGRRRRIKVTTPPRPYLDRAEQIDALLTAAGQLDAEAREDRRHVGRRPMLATLAFAGLRLGELVELRWRDLDLAAGRIRVGAAKTAAGVRTVDMLPALRDELIAWKASRRSTLASGLVFATASGGRINDSNVRNRVLAPAIERAAVALEADGLGALPPRLSPHGLRHLFASLLVALGEDPRFVMEQLGHTTPGFTLRLYAHSMRRDDGDLARLRELVGRANLGQNSGRNGRLAVLDSALDALLAEPAPRD